MAIVHPLLEFDRAGKTFFPGGNRAVRAIENVSFQLQQGEFVCVVGPSGCGKSTVLRLAAGLETATTGSVQYRGRPVSGPGRERGVVFQAYNAFPWLTVRDNIAFGLSREAAETCRSRVDHWLTLTGLSEFADSFPKALSGGMRQRLALARTLVVEPAVLLLDEPFGALDEPVRRSMQSTLLEIVDQLGCSVIFVTHDIREAILLGDRVLLMTNRPGRILESFDVAASRPRPAAFHESPEFGRLYTRILGRFPSTLPTRTGDRPAGG